MRWRNLSLIFCLLCRHGALDVGRRCKTIRFAVRFATFVVLPLDEVVAADAGFRALTGGTYLRCNLD